MSALPIAGSHTLFEISELALVHNLKMMVPPSILIGFGEKHRFVYTDGLTGFVKVQLHPCLEQEQMTQFMQQHMQPIHYRKGKIILSPIIAPRFVLKYLNGENTEVQIYHCFQTCVADAQTAWGQDLIIQQFILPKSCKSSVYRFFANQNTVYNALNCQNVTTVRQNPDYIYTLSETCERIREERIKDEERDMKEKLLQKLGRTISNKTPTTKKFALVDPSKSPKAQETISIQSESALLYFVKLLEKQQQYRESGQSSDELNKDDFYFSKIYIQLQQKFVNDQLKVIWTTSMKNDGDSQIKTRLRPAAYPNQFQQVQKIMKLFANKFIASKYHGRLKSAVFDFIEGENGMLYFAKIHTFETTGVQPFQKEWLLSSQYKQKSLAQPVLETHACQVKVLCQDFDNGEWIRKDFQEKCQQRGLWNFDQGQIIYNVSERLVFMYRMEIFMGKEIFTLEYQKARIIPFYPLISFPDSDSADYEVYQLQRRTNADLMPKLVMNRLMKKRSANSMFGKGVKKMKALEPDQFEDCLSPNPLKKSGTLATLSEAQRTSVQVNQFGEIVDAHANRKRSACLFCAQVIKLFKNRHNCIVFKPKQIAETLSKLKNKLSIHWDSASTDLLLDMYVKPVYENQKLDDSYEHKRQRLLKTSLLQALDQDGCQTKQTYSSMQRVLSASNKSKKVKFQNALMKMSRYRDQPWKLSIQDKEDLQHGPTDFKKQLKTHYSSFRHFDTTERCSSKLISQSELSESEEQEVRQSIQQNEELLVESKSERSESKILRFREKSQGLLETVDWITRSLERANFTSREKSEKFITTNYLQKLQPFTPIMERLRARPKTSKEVILKQLRETQQKAFNKTLKNQIQDKKEQKQQKFKLKIKNFEKSLKPIQYEVQKMIFDAPFAATPYVQSFTDFGFKLRKIRLRSSQSQQVLKKTNLDQFEAVQEEAPRITASTATTLKHRAKKLGRPPRK